MAKSMNDLLNEANRRIHQLEMERYHERASLVMMSTLLVQSVFQRSGISIDAITADGPKRVDMVDINLVLGELRKLAFTGPYSQADVLGKVRALIQGKRDSDAIISRQQKVIERFKHAHAALLDDLAHIQSALSTCASYRIPPQSDVEALNNALNMMQIHLGAMANLLCRTPALNALVVIRGGRSSHSEPFAFNGNGQLQETIQ